MLRQSFKVARKRVNIRGGSPKAGLTASRNGLGWTLMLFREAEDRSS